MRRSASEREGMVDGGLVRCVCVLGSLDDVLCCFYFYFFFSFLCVLDGDF